MAHSKAGRRKQTSGGSADRNSASLGFEVKLELAAALEHIVRAKLKGLGHA